MAVPGPINGWHFVARLGASSQTTQKIILYSYTDDDATVTCSSGFSTTVTSTEWVETGNLTAAEITNKQADNALYPTFLVYTYTLEITGLAPDTEYTWSASQENDPRAKTWGQSFTTLIPAGEAKTFSFITWTCDGINEGTDALFEYILDNRTRYGGIRFIVKQDDVQYLDGRENVNFNTSSGVPIDPDQYWIEGRTGDNASEHDYCASMMCWYGMIDDNAVRGTLRWELLELFPTFEMWGDHEIGNNYRNSAPASVDESTVSAYSPNYYSTKYHTSRLIWDAFTANGMPATLGATFTHSGGAANTAIGFGPDPRDTGEASEVTYNDLYFGFTCADLAIVQVDRNSHACADTTYATNASISVQLLGTDQIDDTVAFMAGSGCKHKLFASSNSVKQTCSGNYGAQENWKDSIAGWGTEFDYWADAVFAEDELNGTDGNMVFYRGNDHNMQVTEHTLSNGLFLTELVCGPVHHSNHRVTPIDTPFDGSTTLWTNGNHQPGNLQEAETYSVGSSNSGITHWTCYADGRLDFRFVNQYGDVVYHGTMTSANTFTRVEQ